MKISEFRFNLPQRSIADSPAEPRDACALWALDKRTGEISKKSFKNIIDYLNPGDVLILNNTKVFKSKISGTTKDGNAIECVLASRKSENTWDCLSMNTRRPVDAGTVIDFKTMIGTVERSNSIGTGFIMRLDPCKNNDIEECIEQTGSIYLPIYLDAESTNNADYQTVYAQKNGSVQPPVAGMHFTCDLLDRIADKGVKVEYVTLHVGRLDVFSPMALGEKNIESHDIYPERYEVSEKCAFEINNAKKNGNKVIGIGTTVVRSLETSSNKDGVFASDGWTSKYIYPGYEFKVIDALVSNLQPPMSTHLILASAFAGRDNVIQLHEYAVNNGGRFLEFGDAALYFYEKP